MPQFKEPQYVPGYLYTSCGQPIILMADEAYRQQFPNDSKTVFTHHLFAPYYYLTERNT